MKWRRLHDLRLRNKLLLLYFLSVFIPVSFTNIIYYQVTTSHVLMQREQDFSLTLDRVQAELRTKVDAAVGISSVFFSDQVIQQLLDQDYASPAAYLTQYDAYIRPILGKYGPVYHSIRAITLYTDNPTVIGAGGVESIDDEVERTGWYQALQDREDGSLLFYHAQEQGEASFSIIRNLDATASSDRYAMLIKIDIHPGAIEQALNPQGLPGSVYLVDDLQTIAYGTDLKGEWAFRPTRFDRSSYADGAVILSKSFDKVRYMKGWSLHGIIPENRMLAELHDSRAAVVYLACVNLLFPTIIISLFARSLHGRLLRILKHMKMLKTQRFELIPSADATDEIGQLASEFNRMAVRMKRLIQDVLTADLHRKELELKRKQAQLHALQSQINPHFLFNTLETLRMRSMMKREQETATIIQHMAKLFRKSLAWGNDWITVRQEMDLIHSFLQIQQYRFDDKLRVRIDVDEVAYDRSIPKMLFLPFVENASLHGIEALRGQGLIEIEVRAEVGVLHFRIRDNGIGITQANLDMLMSEQLLEGDGEEHVGIRNVRARLKLYYGNRARFQIRSDPGEGTTVTIMLVEQIFLQ